MIVIIDIIDYKGEPWWISQRGSSHQIIDLSMFWKQKSNCYKVQVLHILTKYLSLFANTVQ